MGRPIFYISEGARQIDDKWVAKKIQEAVEYFAEYLHSYTPKGLGRGTQGRQQRLSKHTIMGPVGKILSTMLSGRLTSKDSLVGFAMNIHNLTSDTSAENNDIRNLENAIDAMNELKKALPARRWVRVVREVDYGVFKRKMISETK